MRCALDICDKNKNKCRSILPEHSSDDGLINFEMKEILVRASCSTPRRKGGSMKISVCTFDGFVPSIFFVR